MVVDINAGGVLYFNPSNNITTEVTKALDGGK
jgi:Skp family chaperone for outer membrane proteins